MPCSSPAAIATTPEPEPRPDTCTGSDEATVEPLPSWPDPFRPHVQTLPSVLSAMEKPKDEIVVTLGLGPSPGTGCGVVTLLFPPQVNTVPSAFRASDSVPAAIATTPEP